MNRKEPVLESAPKKTLNHELLNPEPPDHVATPRTPSRTAITNLECVFGKNQIVFVVPKNWVLAPPLTRPGQNMSVNNFGKKYLHLKATEHLYKSCNFHNLHARF